MSLGETLLSPVASAEVSDLAPEAVRGRYMGVWTVVWNGGAALGPAFGGWAMDTVGGRQAFAILLVVGLVGAGSFLALAPGWRRRRVRAGGSDRDAPPADGRAASPATGPTRGGAAGAARQAGCPKVACP